jgi:sugar lactone lactonase YvrE
MASGEADMRYHRQGVIAGKGPGRGQFAEALRALAIGPDDRLYAAGDSKLVVFSPEGELLETWPTERPGHAIAVDASGELYVGQPGQVQIFAAAGRLRGTWRDAERLGLVTAIGFAGDSVILADARDRCLRRYDRSGTFRNDIGKDNRMKGFLIPNGCLDFVVDADATIHACNPGKHRIERHTLDDRLLGHIGRFGGTDPAGFSGCCNPTNVTLTGAGQLVVTTKAEPLVKVYTVAGRLLALVGEGDFDPNCKNMDVAVDSRGRIYVADTARLHICVFAPEESGRTSQPADSGTGEAAKP